MECPSCGYRTNIGDKDTNVKCPFCGAALQQKKISSPQKLQSTQDTLELKRRYRETYGDEALYEISNTSWQIKQLWYLIFVVCIFSSAFIMPVIVCIYLGWSAGNSFRNWKTNGKQFATENNLVIDGYKNKHMLDISFLNVNKSTRTFSAKVIASTSNNTNIFCAKCGESNSKANKFCSKCGQTLTL